MKMINSSGKFLFSFAFRTIVVFLVVLLLAIMTIEDAKPKGEPMRAVMLMNGRVIECEIEDYEILHNLSGEMAKIISKDGHTYYTNSFKIIDGEY